MKLTRDEAKEIKALLWRGETNASVARRYQCSDAHISRISTGNAWFDVPWPNGQVGPFPPARRAQLTEDRLRGFGSRGSEDEVLPIGEGYDYLGNSKTLGGRDGLHSVPAGDQPTRVARDQEHDDPPGRVDNPSVRNPRSDPHAEGTVEEVQPEELSDPLSDREAAFHQREARERALSELAELADAQMQEELEAALSAPAKKPRKPAKKKKPKPSKPHYNLLAWDEVVEHGGNLPIVIAAGDDEDFQRCVRAAFKMLPRSMWDSHKAVALVADVAKSLNIKLTKE